MPRTNRRLASIGATVRGPKIARADSLAGK